MPDTVNSAIYLFGVVVGAVVMGLIVGLPPFIWSRKKGHKTAAIISMLLCVLGNFIAGLILSVPICIVSLIVIALLKNETKITQDTVQNAYPNNFQNSNQQTISADFRSCPHCGAKIETSAIYCTNCGNKV